MQSELQSVTSSSSSTRREESIVAQTSSKLDLLFPLVDQIMQFAPLPDFLVFLFTLYTYTQIIFTGIWSLDPFYQAASPQKKIMTDCLYYGGSIFWWLPRGASNTQFVSSFVSLLVLEILSLVIILSVVTYYYKTRKFIKWTLYPINFILICLSSILQHPIACLIGAGLKYSTIGYGNSYIAMTAVAVVLLAINTFIYYLGISLSSKSVYIHVSPVSMWDAAPLFMLMATSSLSIICLIFFMLYGDWTSAVVEVMHMFIMAFILFRLTYHPYHLTIFNSLSSSIITGCICTDLFFFLTTFTPDISFLFAPVIVFFAGAIPGFVIFYLYFTHMKRKIRKELSIIKGEEHDVESDFNDLRLISSKLRAEKYFRIGFTEAADRFLDWSLMKYLNINIPETSFTLIQIMSFFPSEWRSLNVIYSTCLSYANISFLNRYLLFEVNKLKTLRQYSTSNSAIERVAQMKKTSMQCEDIGRSMWTAKNFSIKQFEEYSKRCNDIESIWEESMIFYPNNSKLCDEYTNFLVESKTNFIKAITICSRAQLIEEGHNFVKDISFKLMIKSFPHYMKKGIVDFKGNLVKRNKNEKGSSSSTSKKVDSSGTGQTSLLNMELEEQIGRQLITYGKQRIALNHATKNKRFPESKFIGCFSVFALLINIVIFTAVYLYIEQKFISRKQSTDATLLNSKVRFYTALSIISLEVMFTKDSGRLPPNNYLAGMREVDGPLNAYIDETKPNNISADSYMMKTRGHLEDFMTLLVSYSSQGIDTSLIAEKVIKRTSPVVKCGKGTILESGQRSILTLMNGIFVKIAMLAIMDASNSSWFTSNEYCDLSVNFISNINEISDLFVSLDSYQKEDSDELTHQLTILMGVITIITFLFNFVPVLVGVMLFFKQIRNFQKVILSLEKKVKINASKKIMKTADTDDFLEISSNEEKTRPSSLAFVTGTSCFLSIGLGMLIFGMLYNGESVNLEIEHLNYWTTYANQRMSYSAETIFFTIEAIVLNGSIVQKYSNQSRRAQQALDWVEEGEKKNNNLYDGSSEAPSMIGYDDELDDLNIAERCVANTSNTGLHELYRCASTFMSYNIFNDLVKTIVKYPEEYHGVISNETTLNMVHLASSHMWTNMGIAANKIQLLTIAAYDRLLNESLGFLIGGVAVSIVLLLLGVVERHYMNLISQTVFTLIRRIPPTDLINNKDLLGFLLDRENVGKSNTMNLSQSVLYHSSDGVLLANLAGITEQVNPAVTTILGYKPEQLLGQNAYNVFTVDDGKKVDLQIQLMARKESGPVYEDHLICLNDSGIDAPCFISILLVMDQHTGNPHSFIITIRDESELVKMQEEAEESKEKSEKLLYQILPRDIVIKLNSGEKEISFSVPSASIIFIDIQRFSDYCVGLAPSDIMMHLSTVFAAFDHHAAKYSLLTKIKLIGDDYMAASGLFMKEDDSPSQHAEQILKFALDCLIALDEVNVKNNSSLQVRIGVNSGGPLIAGVLGTDKPVFDIIGDPINIAARLQTTDICGKVHISQNTFDLIQGMDFACEPRGEVFLKGKGKTSTYFVLPMSAFTLSSASIGVYSQITH